MPRRRVTSTEEAEIERLLRAGESRNHVARTVGVSPSTVSKRARALGIPLDGTPTAVATRVRQIDAAARRATLRHDLLDLADRIVAQTSGPHFEKLRVDGGEQVVPRSDPAPMDWAQYGRALASILAAEDRLAATDQQGSELSPVEALAAVLAATPALPGETEPSTAQEASTDGQ